LIYIQLFCNAGIRTVKLLRLQQASEFIILIHAKTLESGPYYTKRRYHMVEKLNMNIEHHSFVQKIYTRWSNLVYTD